MSRNNNKSTRKEQSYKHKLSKGQEKANRNHQQWLNNRKSKTAVTIETQIERIQKKQEQIERTTIFSEAHLNDKAKKGMLKANAQRNTDLIAKLKKYCNDFGIKVESTEFNSKNFKDVLHAFIENRREHYKDSNETEKAMAYHSLYLAIIGNADNKLNEQNQSLFSQEHGLVGAVIDWATWMGTMGNRPWAPTNTKSQQLLNLFEELGLISLDNENKKIMVHPLSSNVIEGAQQEETLSPQ